MRKLHRVAHATTCTLGQCSHVRGALNDLSTMVLSTRFGKVLPQFRSAERNKRLEKRCPQTLSELPNFLIQSPIGLSSATSFGNVVLRGVPRTHPPALEITRTFWNRMLRKAQEKFFAQEQT